MPVFALYNFDDADSTARDSALGNGAQNGVYYNGAAASGGQAFLDGENDLIKIFPGVMTDPVFQMDRGTLDINFTLGTDPLTGTQTVLSRDTVGSTDGGYRVEILANGSVVISHETPTGVETFGTAPGFANPGDSINLSYSWDQGGAGGQLTIDNATTGASFADDVPNTLTMDMSGQGANQPWIIGAGQANSDPNMLNNINQHFQGSVSMFQLSDTVDNLNGDPSANPDTATTAEDTPVTIPVLANDTDPTGQPLTVTTATAPNGTVTVNPNGTLTYTPNADYNGPDTITYTVTDPDGNTSTSTVSVTVTPVNDAPEANPDTSTTPLNTPVTFAVLGNDTDVDGDTLTIQGTPTSPNGTVVVNPDGTLTFTPPTGFTGEAVVNYTIVDAEGLTETTTWTITVGTGTPADGVVRGTDGANLIDASYVDPFDADRVDNNDALLPCEVGNDDIIEAGAGNDTVLAGNGNDDVRAGTGDDSVNGGDGNDAVLGGLGNDSIFGDAGDDTLAGDEGNDEIVGGLGNDSILGGANDDNMQGNDGNDTLQGDAGNDTLIGGAGDDLIVSGTAGSPDRTYPGLYTADTNPNDDRDSVVGGFGNDTILTGDDADTIIAGIGNDSVDAGNDDDVVNGGLDNDTLLGGEGNDTVNGDAGDDLIYGGTVGNTGPTDLIDAVDLDDDNNRDSLLGGEGNDSIYGGDDADTLDAGDGNDVLDGGIDDDSIRAGTGDDSVLGGEGDDTIDTGAGNDTIRGDGPGVADSNDRAYPGLYPADAIPDNNRDFITAGLGNDLVYGGDDADTLFGDGGDDTLYAGIDADSVVGGEGNDTLVGEEGSDTMDGGVGNDLLVGGTYTPGAGDPVAQPNPLNLTDATDLDPGNDRDSLSGGFGNDTIYGGDDDDTLDGGDSNDLVYGGIDDDLITGGAGDDSLFGDQGDDTVNGGAGNDLVTNGAGNDSVVGGADRDTIIGANADDFVDGSEAGDDNDTLDLRGLGPISIVYDPTNAENGTVTFLDAAGNPTGTMDFINIENVLSDAPDANPDTATTPEDTPVTIPVLANDTDPNGDPLEVTEATAPNGTVTINPDGTLSYTPNPDFNGTDTITYTVTDPDGNESTTTVTVTVTPVNDAPVAEDDASTTPFDTPITFAVLGNDSDVDGDTLTIQGTPTSPDGTVAVNADGTLTFTPNPGFTGEAVVNYTIVDEEGLTDTATWTITVQDEGVPAANDDAATTPEDTPVTIPVLGNDVDPEGQPLTVIDATAPNGTVSVNPDGTLTYTPNPDFNGTDTITYTITDPDGNEDTATVTVTVTPVNDAPVAEDDASTTPFNTPITFAVVANDSDPDGDTLTILGTPTSPNGTVARNPDGTLTFTPTTGFVGNAVVTYTIVDEEGLTDTATWTIAVRPVGDDRDGVVRGTTGGDLIDGTYVDPFDADRVDNNDALLPGEVGNDDIIEAGAGNDTILAGLGNDDVRAGTGDDTVSAGSGDDSVLGGLGNDTIAGDAGNDTLRGDEGNDSILGGLGNDSVVGGAGNDTLEGNTGNDTLLGGLGNDTILGGANDDLLNGGAGNDSLVGGDGNDSLLGELGNDTLTGGNGNDTVDGGTGDDLIDTTGSVASPDIDYPGLYPADTDPNNDRDSVIGGAGNDTIRTGDDADTISAGGGNDLVDAGVDADVVFGGAGNDTLVGSEGGDTIDGDNGDDLIYGGLNDVIGDALDLPDAVDLRPDNNRDSINGGAGNDTIFGRDDDDTIFGGTGSDLIDGGVDEDSVVGGAGDDTITGGQGADTLSGGDDQDRFLVSAPGTGIGDVIDGNEGGVDNDTLDLTGSGPLSIDYDDTNPENGVVTFYDADRNITGTMTFTNIENVIPCFTPGTLIATPKGEVPVEMLKAGDRVITRDNGIQEIRWTGQKVLGWHDLAANQHLKPVLIRQGSLGNGLPERDMMVSPNHRMLVANDRTALYFDEHEVLVAAKHLVGAQGIQAIDAVGTTYIHFMFDRHEVVLGNGAWTESFQPGDMTLKGMGNAQRSEIFDLFPELKTVAGMNGYAAARKTLKRHEALLLVK